GGGADRPDAVEGVVQRRPDQVVHGGVLDNEVLAARLLGEDDAADEYAGVADDKAPRLEDELAAALLDRRDDDLGEGAGRQGLLLAVVDAEAAAHVQVADRVALLPHFLDQGQPLIDALPVRRRAEDRRAEV